MRNTYDKIINKYDFRNRLMCIFVFFGNKMFLEYNKYWHRRLYFVYMGTVTNQGKLDLFNENS